MLVALNLLSSTKWKSSAIDILETIEEMVTDVVEEEAVVMVREIATEEGEEVTEEVLMGATIRTLDVPIATVEDAMMKAAVETAGTTMDTKVEVEDEGIRAQTRTEATRAVELPVDAEGIAKTLVERIVDGKCCKVTVVQHSLHNVGSRTNCCSFEIHHAYQ